MKIDLKKPRALVVISWAWIGWGAFMFLFAVIAVPFVWITRKLSERTIVDAIGRALTARFNQNAESQLT